METSPLSCRKEEERQFEKCFCIFPECSRQEEREREAELYVSSPVSWPLVPTEELRLMMRRSTSFLSRTREAGPSSDIALPPKIQRYDRSCFNRCRRCLFCCHLLEFASRAVFNGAAAEQTASWLFFRLRLTYDDVAGRGRAADGALGHGGVAAARHPGELGLRHHLQTVAALPAPGRELDVVCQNTDDDHHHQHL